MGNISFIIPSDKKDEFTIANITEMLRKRFSKLKFELLDIGQLIVWKNNDIVCELWLQKECYLLKENEDEEDEDNFLNIEWINKLDSLNLTDEVVLGSSYGYTPNHNYRSEILTYIIDYFKGYWLDEGIHPEFISYTDEFLNEYR